MNYEHELVENDCRFILIAKVFLIASIQFSFMYLELHDYLGEFYRIANLMT